MKKIALIYWPKKGNTEDVAYRIYNRFNKEEVDIFTITGAGTAELETYDGFIIGGSTTGADHWEDAHKTRWADFFNRLGSAKIEGKPFAIFGLGDQILYPYHFVDGMRDLKEQFEKNGAVHIGLWPVEGYEFKDSDSMENGMFFGLALDLDRQKDLTDDRIGRWVLQVKKEFGM